MQNIFTPKKIHFQIRAFFLALLVFSLIFPFAQKSSAAPAACTTGDVSLVSPPDGANLSGIVGIEVARNGGCTDDVNIYWGRESTTGATTCDEITSWHLIGEIEDPGSTLDWNTNSALGNGADYCLRIKTPAGQTKTAEIVVDNLANTPEFTRFAVFNVDSSHAKIRWHTEGDVILTQYSVGTVPYGHDVLNWTELTGSVYEISNDVTLNPNKTYYVQGRMIDTTNRVTAGAPQKFTTAAASTGISVDRIEMTKTFATADNTFANGWKWKFHVTVNNVDDNAIAMKFINFKGMDSSFAAANNIRFSLDDATWVGVTAENTYSDPNFIISDEEPTVGGVQITIYVEVKMPEDTPIGSYSTGYGIQSLLAGSE